VETDVVVKVAVDKDAAVITVVVVQEETDNISKH
jgi:hypothetical protein